MASWRHSAIKLTIVAMSSIPQYDCDPLAEPAGRFETCVERAVAQLKRPGSVLSVPCDLKLQGRYVVVLHPPGELSNDDLMSAGLPQNLVPELRAMRMKGGPAIYVFSANREVKGIGSRRTVPSSRTTSQSTFLEINELMVFAKNTQPLTIEVSKTQHTNVIRRMR